MVTRPCHAPCSHEETSVAQDGAPRRAVAGLAQHIVDRDPHVVIADERLVVLATEPGSTDGHSQLGGVALLDRHGSVLLYTRICPARTSPLLTDPPPIEVVWPALAALLTNRIVASYHVARDRCLLRQTARCLGATLLYSEWYSVDQLDRRASKRSQRCAFATACRQHQIPIHPTPHALADARATLAILRALARPTIVPPPRHIFWRYLK